jgi:maleamate amidohydrolase
MTAALDPSRYPAYAAECGDPSRTKKLGFGVRPAVLLLDICEAYFLPDSPLAIPDKTLHSVSDAIRRILEAARSSRISQPSGDDDEIPVIFAQTYYTHTKLQDAGLQTLKSSHVALFSARNPQNLVSAPRDWPSLCPEPNDIQLRKKYPSPFFGTNFATQLAALGVDTLIIAGFTTSGSVRSAVLDAMQSGFRPMIVAEGCADRGHETHWANLMDLGAKYGDVISVEQATAALQAGWRP